MKYSVIILLALFFASCHNYKEDAEKLQTQVDSLQVITEQKDSTIDAFIGDFNEIQSNLDSIKKLEEMLSVPAEPSQQLSARQKDKILNDIASINALLRDNQDLIASLRTRLNNSSFKSGKLQEMVNDLEELTKNLQTKVSEKDTEIANLNEDIQQKSENINMLNDQLTQMEDLSQKQLDSLKRLDINLNKGYYVVGSVNELKDEGIVEREGGILGIGSTPVVSETFTRDDFNEVDIRNFNFLPLNSRKADVISVHPADSYHITGENADTLYVDKPGEFWSASKYLVVATR